MFGKRLAANIWLHHWVPYEILITIAVYCVINNTSLIVEGEIFHVNPTSILFNYISFFKYDFLILFLKFLICQSALGSLHH